MFQRRHDMRASDFIYKIRQMDDGAATLHTQILSLLTNLSEIDLNNFKQSKCIEL